MVIISTVDYNKIHDLASLIECPTCESKQDMKKTKMYELIMPLITNIISNNGGKVKVWDCVSCHKTNELKSDQVTTQVLKEPYFLQVVPKPPLRHEGMMDRKNYHIQFSTWFWTCLGEIEHQLGQFRDDNWQKGDEADFNDSDIMDGGEENE